MLFSPLCDGLQYEPEAVVMASDHEGVVVFSTPEQLNQGEQKKDVVF